MYKVNTVILLTLLTLLYDTLMAEEPNCPRLCEGRHSYVFVANNKDGIAFRQFAPIGKVEKKVLVDFVDVKHSKNVNTVVGQFDENVVWVCPKF